MKFEQLIVLLPCHSLEDLSLHRDAQEAEQLLSGWSVLFHPALLEAAHDTPKWFRADSPPENPAGCLIIVPPCCESLLPTGWLAQAQAAEGALVRGAGTRSEVAAAALGFLGDATHPLDADLTADFFALGFCHFQVELLTRQLRYMSNLDEIQFRQRTLAAAEEALKGSAETARDYLRSAFDLLTESREYFYPVQAHLLDLTLVASTTMGASLRSALARRAPVNLLLSAETLGQMAQREPGTLEAIKKALETQKVAILGGDSDEPEFPLMTLEPILAALRRALAAYERHLGQRPAVFARRRFGLTPLLPQILRKLGFHGALHFTLDEGRFPVGNQSKIRWEGLDGTAIEALAKPPLDASGADAFLCLGETLGRAMDLDHAATAVLAHWPGRESVWYDALQRMAEYSPALGKFDGVAEYFRATEYVGQASRYTADQYRSPYLKQEVAAGKRDPISRWVRYYRVRSLAEAALTLGRMAQWIRGVGTGDESASAARLLDQVEASRSGALPTAEVDALVSARLESAMQALGRALTPESVEPRTGCLVLNPHCFTQRQCVQVATEGRLAEEAPIWKSAPSPQGQQALVDLPAMGFAWVVPETASSAEPKPMPKPKQARRDEPPLAEEHIVRNDYFQVELNPVTGAIQSIHDFSHRHNRLAQQVAFRSGPPSRHAPTASDPADAESRYTVMAADQIEVLSPGPLVGKIASRGRLVDREGQTVARFVQTLCAWRGSRVLELQIELDTYREPDPDPWNSYYAARFAWGDATAEVYRSLHAIGVPTEATQIEAPLFVELRSEATRTTILTGGLPYHRRYGLRKLDSLLIVRGETARRFRLGIGIDLAHPAPAALGFLSPPLAWTTSAAPPGASGWLFHVNAKNVIATAWEPLCVDRRVLGFRVRLLETEGRPCEVTLRSFRTLRTARKTNLGASDPLELPVDGDALRVGIGAHEWIELEAEFGT